MQVREIMTREPACCSPDTKVQEVAKMMLEHDCGVIPVVESSGSKRPIGVVTDRDIAARVVAEGRDIGTKVFPSAAVKFFLEADPNVRAERRHRELVAAGHGGAIEQTSAELAGRDDRDRSRAAAPLIAAEDAHHIDTSCLSAEDVVNQMLAVVTAKL